MGMIIDMQFLGYGAGFVMVGWVAGMVVSVVFGVVQKVRGI